MSAPLNRRGGAGPRALVVVAAPEGVTHYPETSVVPRSFKNLSSGLWLRAADAFWNEGLDIDLGTDRLGKGFFIKHVYVGGSTQDDHEVAPEFLVRVFARPTFLPGTQVVRVPLEPHMIPQGAVFSLCMGP